MVADKFVNTFRRYAVETERKTGISAIFTLAQAALESGWGERAIGNMFFGVKDTDGLNGNEQLLTTTEYSTKPDLKFPEVISVEKVIRNGKEMYKYKVKDWFRRYDTPEQSFTDHANFFIRNKRYAEALKVKGDAMAFAEAIAKAGYATDPSYATTLKAVIKTVKRYY